MKWLACVLKVCVCVSMARVILLLRSREANKQIKYNTEYYSLVQYKAHKFEYKQLFIFILLLT